MIQNYRLLIVGLLLIVVLIILLKATGWLNWSWIWVFSPVWISALLGVVFLALFLLVLWRDG